MKPQRAVILFSMALAMVLLFNLWSLEAAAETVLWSGPNTPAHLALSKRHLCWSDDSETPVKSMSICGGDAIALAMKMGVPANLSIKSQNIFWIDERSGTSPSGNCTAGHGVAWMLNKSPLDGTSKAELARGDHCNGGTDDIVVDETHVYWVNSKISPMEFTIRKVPIAGGDSTTLATISDSSQMNGLAGDATYIYWAQDGIVKKIPKSGGQIEILADQPGVIKCSLAINGGEVFFSVFDQWDTYYIMKVSVLGGSSTTLASVTRGAFEPKNWARAIAVDNENLYWIDDSTVNSVPVAGGSITTLANILNEPIDLVVNGSQVIWTESTGPAHGETGTVKSVSTTGGEVTTLVQGGNAPRKLALYSSEIYWTEGGPIGLIEGFGRIAKMAVGGGNITTVMQRVGESTPIASDGSYLYLGDKFSINKMSIDGSNSEILHTASDEIGDLTTDGSNVYWISKYFSTVHKIPASGGATTTLSSELDGLSGPIRTRNGYVYWIANHEIIKKVSTAGGQVITLASNLPFLNDLVVDDIYVYFSEQDTGDIRKMSINGGSITTVISPSAPPHYLSVDEQNLYWISKTQVGSIPKGGGSATIIDTQVQSDQFLDGSIVVDSTGLYWTETAIGAIMKQEFGVCYSPNANSWLLLLLFGG